VCPVLDYSHEPLDLHGHQHPHRVPDGAQLEPHRACKEPQAEIGNIKNIIMKAVDSVICGVSIVSFTLLLIDVSLAF